VDALELAVTVFEIWKPTIESSVETIKTDVQKLSNHWNRAVKDKVTTDQGLYPPPGTTPASGTTPPVGTTTLSGSVSPHPSSLKGTA
jgi:hypothetical protein